MEGTCGPHPLLPAYIPSAAFSSSFQSSPLLSPSNEAPLDIVDYFGRAPAQAEQLAAHTSTSTVLMGADTSSRSQYRSSLSSRHREVATNAMPGASNCSSPSTPLSLSAGSDYLSSSLQSSTSTAPSSVVPSPSLDAPYIKLVTVPHHSGSGKSCLFACRVVPDLDVPNVFVEKVQSRRTSLGKMRMAGTGEPHTVWRSWQECLEFSASLSASFPDDRPVSATSADAFLAPRHKVPRLQSGKKLTHLFKSSSQSDRQADLEVFFAQLFDMTQSIRHSPLVRNFFSPRPSDTLYGARSASPCDLAFARISPSVPEWLVAGDQTNDLSMSDSNASTLCADATIKAPRKHSARPTLAIKTSSPDLRGADARGFGRDAELMVPSPLSVRHATPVAPAMLLSPSSGLQSAPLDVDVVSSTTASLRTVTPLPQSRPSTPSSSGSFAQTLRKKASGGLRHIRSLGDLRGSNRKVETPNEPVPTLSPDALAAAFGSIAMDRAASQPILPRNPPTAPTPLWVSQKAAGSSTTPSSSMTSSLGRLPAAPSSAPLVSRHRRSGSSKSSVTSFEDLWGSPFPTAFRQTTSGRVECVRDPGHSVRRPSLSTSAVRAPFTAQNTSYPHSTQPLAGRRGHRPSSSSVSSMDSLRSGGSSGSVRSHAMSASRSSAGSELCPTPPTPLGEWGVSAVEKSGTRIVAGKFYVENGVLHENNTVPPPPFFPIPPPMQFAYSHDGLPHTPRTSGSSVRTTHVRKPSMDQQYPPTPRSRVGSMASARRVSLLGQTSLDAILASPTTSSAASSPRTVGGSRTAWTIKLLHRDENVVLRLSKPTDGTSLALETLRCDVQAKFQTCGVTLPLSGEWGLAWTTREPGVASSTKLVVQQEDLDDCLRTHDDAPGKIVLRVIC